ncbi:Filamentous growth regulator 27 [Colletotrichum siamense]|uniref:Filamentous growth regulator 27 n=1 Tax=Colletotrichum siamense TaxID=690259 RepID=UPI001872C187|nr:Filamentous growth regulator 27 [Colletotrichum siamense]KAF5501750.1 Filamentous growth regulator 27 [Colletotrichum siamense]
MPRPKVPESLRQRAAEACSFCREAKKRCSGTAPCTQCVRRGLERDCCMTELPRGSRTRKISKSSAGGGTRRSRATPALDNESITVSVSSPVSPRDRSRRSVNGAGQRQLRLSPPASQQEDEETSMNVDPQPLTPPRETQVATDPSLLANPSRMLRSLHGEQVYVGGAAAISFLQTVRQVVAGQIGPSPFSHNDDTETMLEVESPETRATTSPSAETAVELNVQQKLAYLHCYYSATEGLIDIFDPSERQQLFNLAQSQSSTNTSDDRPSTPPNILPDPIREMVIAIGAQCSSASEAQTIGRSCFRRAQRQAFAELLEDPDLHMVRLFLLMSFYMLGECRRNTAYILRVWISVRILDKLVNSLLGRPAATAGVQTDIRAALDQLPPHPDDYATQCLTATCEIVDIINEINNTLYHDKDVSATVVEHLLLKIDAWKRGLPPSLKGSLHHHQPSEPESSSSSTQRVAIAKIHVSCLYYFAVTLATRPIFISSLNSNRPDAKIHHPPLAAACIDAAVYLAQTCADALKAGLLQRSMCIMKALVFAAGLVLGVENFAKSAIDIETDRAFQGAIDVLAFLAAQSHQAAHYLEILTSLSNAISERRAKPAPVGGSRYVSKLFSLDPPCPASSGSNMFSQRHQGEDETGFWPLIRFEQGAVGESGISGGGLGAGDPGSWPEVQLDDDDLSIDWESLNIFQWDSFPFNA